MSGRGVGSALALWLCLASASAWALPATVSQSDTDDDATITIRTLSQTILGDARTWCQVRIVVMGSSHVPAPDVDLTAGDTVELWVYEDDLAGDELLWSGSFSVTSGEATGGVDRTFDCSGNFGDDIGAEAEYYAQGKVTTENCGFGCIYDRPETAVVTAAEVDDDGAEPDDTSGTANPLGLGTTSNRIARDQDWTSFELVGPAQVEVTAIHDPSVGRLDVTLFDSGNSVVVTGTDRTGDTRVYDPELTAGIYRVRVAPRVGNDFNFYDLRLTVTPIATDCDPGDMEFEDCGNCGLRSRECTELGRWTAFGDCTDEGECAAGDETTDSCGLCGLRRTTCSDTCEWVVGDCEAEGPCEPETVETEACGVDQERQRVCDSQCQWGEYTECGGTQCVSEAVEACYTGPASARGVGACQEGLRTCSGGLWGNCEGEVLPTTEDCDDGLDNDCDGKEDNADESCVTTVGDVGDPCLFDAECAGDLECLRSPDYPSFAGGYCGGVDCDRDLDCGVGGLCGTVFGQSFCLKACDTSGECRAEYTCAGVGTDLACVPRCDRNSDCLDPDFPLCDSRNGICQPLPTTADEGGPEPVVEPVPDAGADAVEVGGDVPTGDTEPDGVADGDAGEPPAGAAGNEACGCGAAGGLGDASSVLLVMLGLALSRLRWRRRGRA